MFQLFIYHLVIALFSFQGTTEEFESFLTIVLFFFCNLSITGGDEEDRTPDPLLARQVLSQLSYTPMWFAQSCIHYAL